MNWRTANRRASGWGRRVKLARRRALILRFFAVVDALNAGRDW